MQRKKHTAEEVIAELQLEPLAEEGGFFRRTYQSKYQVPGKVEKSLGLEQPPKDEAKEAHQSHHSFSTAIYFLVTPTSFSALHKLRTDEIFHFYGGDPVQVLRIHPENGKHELVMLGNDIFSGQRPQVLVPAGTWQASRLAEEHSSTPDSVGWALLGTTMAPGYENSDFELGDQQQLAAAYPGIQQLIEKFSAPPAA